jgi:hypothetical protein
MRGGGGGGGGGTHAGGAPPGSGYGQLSPHMQLGRNLANALQTPVSSLCLPSSASVPLERRSISTGTAPAWPQAGEICGPMRWIFARGSWRPTTTGRGRYAIWPTGSWSRRTLCRTISDSAGRRAAWSRASRAVAARSHSSTSRACRRSAGSWMNAPMRPRPNWPARWKRDTVSWSAEPQWAVHGDTWG